MNDKEIFRRKCLRLWLCKPEYMERTKWGEPFRPLAFSEEKLYDVSKRLKEV